MLVGRTTKCYTYIVSLQSPNSLIKQKQILSQFADEEPEVKVTYE